MPDLNTTSISRLLRERLRVDAELARHQQLVTVLFVDIVGSTRFYERYGDVAGLSMVQKFLDKLLPLVEEHKGVVVKTLGDAILARFEKAEDAVYCALDMQWSLLEYNGGRSPVEQIHIRVALNSGFALVKGNDVFGDVVNVCSRIEGAAQPDDILISPSVYDQVCLTEGIAVRRRAEGVALKGKTENLDLYEVVWRFGDPVGAPPPRPSDAQVAMAALPAEEAKAAGEKAPSEREASPGAAARTPERRALAAGSVLANRYRVVTMLGRGGMGEVYRAEDMTLGQEVALKFLPEASVADADLLERFHAEVRNARQVSHPNVCRVYDIGESQGRHFIAMEYVDGEDLQTLLRRIGRLPPDKAQEIAYQLCAGLAAAHSVGVLHRDLKTSNIMIDGRGRARITDFGLAVRSEEAGLREPAGTPAFMAPEMLAGHPASVQTDLYSLGLILYELFTGKSALEPDPQTKKRSESPVPPSRYLAELNPTVEQAILHCLQRDPRQRPCSASETATEMAGGDWAAAAAVGETSISGERPRSSRRAISPLAKPESSRAVVLAEARRHKGVTAAIAAALVVLLAGFSVGLYLLLNHKPAVQDLNVVRLTQSGNATDVSLSPDGRYVVYVLRDGEQQSLNLRHIPTGSDVRLLPPDLVTFSGITFSPDGNYIYFVRTSGSNPNYSDLFQIPVLGGAIRPLLRNIDTAVSFSPDGKQFAFVRGVPDSREVHLMVASADGSGERILSRHPASTFFDTMFGPAWSPDGKTIAVTTCTNTSPWRADINLVDVATGTSRVLYKSPTPMGRPQWRPDNRSLVVVIQDPSQGFRGQLWQASVAGGGPKRLTNDLTDYQLCCLQITRDGGALTALDQITLSDLWVWSPASEARQITTGGPSVFVVSWTTKNDIVFQNAEGDLLSIQPDGKNRKLLTPVQHGNLWPSVCGDGRIIFAALGSDKVNVWRVDADGSNLAQVTDEPYTARPQCSPDGKWVVFVGNDGTAWRVPIEGGTPKRLVANLSTRRTAISPDGKLVAYIAMPASVGGPNLLKVARTDDGSEVYSFDLPVGAAEPEWTRQGDGLHYLLTRGGVTNLWQQKLNGGAPTQVTDFKSGMIYHYDWSHDGKQLAFSRGASNSNVVLINNLR